MPRILTLVLALLFVALAAAQKTTFHNFKVFRIHPKNDFELELLKSFERFTTDEYTFWKEPGHANDHVDLMVAPHKNEEFHHFMKSSGMDYESFVENVQELVEKENPQGERLAEGSFDWRRYHTLEEIYGYLDGLAKNYPDLVETIIGGRTYEGRQIKGVKLSFKDNNPGIFIEGGIHAREWISPATVTYILDQLINSNDTEVRELAESNDWYIFPSFNPDGYVYTHLFNRLWRKTRKPYGFFCHGSDPNRNWGYKWKQGGSSSNPCTETFAGSAPFSDVETKTLSQYITSISDKFYAYLSFHSYSQLLLFPYGHTTAHLDNYDELYSIGTKTIQALAKRYGTKYVTGDIAETIYVATGGSMDWVKGTFKTPITYTYELRDTGKYGFLLPAEQIIPTGEETLDSLVGLFKAAKTFGYPENS